MGLAMPYIKIYFPEKRVHLCIVGCWYVVVASFKRPVPYITTSSASLDLVKTIQGDLSGR